MKVAIVSNMKLPDPRVERQMYTFLRNGFNVFFIGRYLSDSGIVDLSKVKIYNIYGWDHRVNLGFQPYYFWMKRKVGKILKEVRPDIVLAPNVYVGHMIDELGYPLIIDDRENYSIKRYYGISHIRQGFKRYIQLLYIDRTKKFEEELSSKHSILTVTLPGYVYYRRDLGAPKVYLIRNYPLSNEALEAETVDYTYEGFKKVVVFNYIGKEISKQLYGTIDSRYMFLNYHRIIKPTIEVLYKLRQKYSNIKLLVIGDNKISSDRLIDSIGYVRHKLLYKYFKTIHFGLYSYRPTIYHQFVSSFRVYMYMLSGVPVVITSSFKDLVDVTRGYSIVVDEYNYIWDLFAKIRDIIESFELEEYIKLRKQIRGFALKNTIWEKNESELLDAIKMA